MIRAQKGAGERTRVAAGSVSSTKTAVGVGGAVGLTLEEGFAVVRHLDVALGGVECEEVVDHHARHARTHLVGTEGLEPMRSAGDAMVKTPVLQGRGN